jgi:hypothetical protein
MSRKHVPVLSKDPSSNIPAEHIRETSELGSIPRSVIVKFEYRHRVKFHVGWNCNVLCREISIAVMMDQCDSLYSGSSTKYNFFTSFGSGTCAGL